MSDKPDVGQVKCFDKTKLKKTETEEKVHMPTQAEIDAEKAEAAAATS